MHKAVKEKLNSRKTSLASSLLGVRRSNRAVAEIVVAKAGERQEKGLKDH